MKRRMRCVCILAVCVCLVGSYLPLHVNAAQKEEAVRITEMRATKDFSVTVSAGTIKTLKTMLPLASNEGVTIQAYYSPEDAAVDFGLIYPDGTFHYVSASGGHIDTTLTVGNPGDYKFAIRNNSSQTITVAGYIKY